MSKLEDDVAALAIKTKDNTNSMLADVLRGSETEIDFINGAVVELGKKYGVDMPWNEEVIKKIKEIKR